MSTDINSLPSADTLFQLQLGRYMYAASLVVLFYDYLLTIKYEVKYIWGHKWGIGKVLFLFARYPAFIDTTIATYFVVCTNEAPENCRVEFFVWVWCFLFGVLVSEAILLVRVYAIWDRNAKFLFSLVFLFVVVMAFSAAVIGKLLRPLRFISPTPLVPGCAIDLETEKTFSNFMVPIALLTFFETVIVSLTVWAGIKKYRDLRNSIFEVIQRDGILYFVCLFVISLSTVVLMNALPDFKDSLFCLHRVMHSVFGTRIQLHLHKAYNKLSAEWLEWPSSASRIVFERMDLPQHSQA